MHVPRGVAVIALLALAGTARPMLAQAPLTADSLHAIVSAAQQAVRTITSMANGDADVQTRARVLRADFESHNAEQCEYLQGKPESCANYDAERLNLLARSDALQREMRAREVSRRTARAQFAAAMDRLRTSSYAASVSTQKAELVRCADLKDVPLVSACLARTPAAMPPR
jgi:hypothetical protein